MCCNNAQLLNGTYGFPQNRKTLYTKTQHLVTFYMYCTRDCEILNRLFQCEARKIWFCLQCITDPRNQHAAAGFLPPRMLYSLFTQTWHILDLTRTSGSFYFRNSCNTRYICGNRSPFLCCSGQRRLQNSHVLKQAVMSTETWIMPKRVFIFRAVH